MKKFLFAVTLVFALTSARTQILNELMSVASNCNNPDGGAEFFEIYGNSGAVNLDCYALVVYFQNATEKGFYVVDLPNVTPTPNGSGQWWYVVSSQLNFCIATNTGGSANESWNTLGVKKYTYDYSTNSYNPVQLLNNVQDLFVETGTGAGGTSFQHNAMLFSYQSGSVATLVNGVFSNMSQPGTFPLVDIFGDPDMAGMPPNIPGGIVCGANSYDISFASLGAFSVEYLTQNAGSGNGFYRRQDGICGTWDKASSASEHTPGTFAPGGSTTSQYSITGTLPVCFDEDPDPLIVNIGFKSSFTFNFPVGDVPYVIEYYIIRDDGDNVLEPSPQDTYYGPYTEDNDPVLSPPNTITVTLPDAVDGDRYFIRAKSLQGCFFATQTVVCPTCSTLPVELLYFNARRNGPMVELNWQTVTEVNNRGFNVQRKIGTGSWENLAFVASAAFQGNSQGPLNYSFNDPNSQKAISQYRLEQVDIDGKPSYSAIRIVRGDGQKSKTMIYPNPSNNGSVTVVFEDMGSVRNINLMDVSGRTIRKWNGVTNNNLQILDLNTGIYILKILSVETGEQIVEKIVVRR